MPSTATSSAPRARERETLRQSAAYSAGGEAASRLVTVCAFVVLARLLSPRDFGLVAMITVASGFFAVILELGFAQALVHFQNVSDELYSTAFVLNVLAGAAVAACVFLGAHWIARFCGEAGLAELIRLMSVVFVLNPIASIQVAMLQKERAFRRIAEVEIGAVLAGATVALVLAWRGSGVWALAWNVVVIAAVRAVLYSILSPRSLRFRFAWTAAARLWRFGRYVLLANTFTYAALNLDQLLVGKFLGPAILGAYRYGGQLVTMPQSFISRTLNTVLVSWYSEKQADPQAIKATHLQVMQVVSFYALPALMLAAVLADCLVPSVLGRNWEVLIGVIQILAVVETVQVLGAVNGPLFLAQGRTRQLFLISLLRLNVLLGVLAGLPFGLSGVLWGVLIARLVNFYPSIHFGVGHLGLGFFEVIRRIGMNALLAVVMSGGLLVLKSAGAPDRESVGALLTLTACGVFLYVSLSYLFNRGVLIESLRTVLVRVAR